MRTDVKVTGGEADLDGDTGTPQNWLPLRHRQQNEAGEPATLRIVKSPTEWTSPTVVGRPVIASTTICIEDGVPVGLDD